MCKQTHAQFTSLEKPKQKSWVLVIRWRFRLILKVLLLVGIGSHKFRSSIKSENNVNEKRSRRGSLPIKGDSAKKRRKEVSSLAIQSLSIGDHNYNQNGSKRMK